MANLAWTFAQGGYNTLIVDADLRRPTQHRIFGLNGDHGLSDFLTTDIDLEDIVQTTSLPNLFLLPSGKLPHDAVGVLKAADFSMFVRDRNRVSEVGFPTKYAEAATCGIPVLTNRTSDIGDYLVDGENGILLPDCSPASIEHGLARA